VHPWQLNTPVAFIIFNRPDKTERVFAEIAQAKPPRLLVVADGPRPHRPGEEGQCQAARAVIDRVNWNCEVLKNYSDVNLGCRNRVASGIDWIFEHVPEAIILEDDCLPHPTFFPFCEELLERYRDDEAVLMISGANHQLGRPRGEASYYFSRYMPVWGWASWRRAWRHYDRAASCWPAFRDSGALQKIIDNSYGRRRWNELFQAVYDARIDTWDYQLLLAAWKNGMVSVIPNVNLISNIGFNAEATHTKGHGVYSALPTNAMRFPLCHPTVVRADQDADNFVTRQLFPSLLRRAINYWLRLI
jgi:hypothetical protein